MKHLFASLILLLSSLCAFAQTEYIVHSVTGEVTASTTAGAWQKVERLSTLPSSATVDIPDGGSLVIYSKKSPQTLKINTPGQHRLRAAARAAAKTAAAKRSKVLSPIVSGAGHEKTSVRSGVVYRSPADDKAIAAIAATVAKPSESDTYGLSITDTGDGLSGLTMTNKGKEDVEAAVIVCTDGHYSPLQISDNSDIPSIMLLPAGATYNVPECQLLLPAAPSVIMVVCDRSFDTDALCLILNNPPVPTTTTPINATAVLGK